jgi:hypothetical protein
VPSAACDCGTGIKTVEHSSWECPRLTKDRAELINIPMKNGRKQNLRSLAEMLKMQTLRDVKGLVKFINNIPKYM